jgi:hypothetical protein
MEYHIVVKDILGNTIGEFDHFRNLQYKTVLNKEGDCAFDIDLKDEKATAAFIALGARDVYIYRDDDISWGGRMWNYNGRFPSSDSYMTIRVQGFLRLLKKMCIYAKESYTGIDAGTLLWDRINARQALPYGDFGITLGSIAPSFTVDEDIEFATLYDEAQKLANTAPGFDYEITQTKVFNVYAKKGTDKSDTIIYDLDKNMSLVDFSSDFEETANEVCVQGAGNGEGMATQTVTDTALAASYGLLQKIVPFKNASDLTLLTEKANFEIAKNGLASRQYSITNNPGREPDLTDVEVGDYVRVRSEYGNFISISDSIRIASLEVSFVNGIEYIKPNFLYGSF